MLGVLLVIVAAVLVGLTIAGNLINNSGVALHHGNTTVILTQLNHFFIESLTVTQDTGYPGDTDHEIDVYLVNSKCNDLPSLDLTYTQTGSDSSSVNKTTLYALTGSSITYSICGSSNNAKESERLELVIFDTLESEQSPLNIHNSFHEFAYFNIGNRDQPLCNEFSYIIETTGYYTALFLPPPHPAHFEFNVTYNIKLIDSTQLSVVANHILYVDKDSHNFPLDFDVRSSCLVATIKNASKPYVHIQLDLKTYLELTTSLGVGCTAIFIAIVAILSTSISCCYFLWRRAKTASS